MVEKCGDHPIVMHLNPWNYKLGLGSITTATSLIAFSAIAAVAGLFSILTSLHVPLGPLNALCGFSLGGGFACLSAGLLVYAIAVTWLVTTTFPNTVPKISKNQISNDQSKKFETFSQGYLFPKGFSAPLSEANLETYFQEFNHRNPQIHLSHLRAKTTFTSALKKFHYPSPLFPTPPKIQYIENLKGEINANVFQSAYVPDIQNEILKLAKDQDHLHVFQIASKYNGSPIIPDLPKMGEAMLKTRYVDNSDFKVQTLDPVSFEFVNAFLGNLGFNMLENVFVEMPSGEDFSLEFGSLVPNQKNVKQLSETYQKNYQKIESVCYRYKLESNLVTLLLQSAPNCEMVKKDESALLQQYNALANYLALFQYGIDYALSAQRPVILHVRMIEARNPFFNAQEFVRWGFKRAALALQKEMESAQVTVQIMYENDQIDDRAYWIAKNCNLLGLGHNHGARV